MARNHIAADDIRKAAEIIRKKRPAYAAMIDFYVNVFVAQQLQIAQLRPPEPFSEGEVFDRRQKEGLPLTDPSQFWIDHEAARSLFGDIVEFAAQADAPVAAEAERLWVRVRENELDLDTLLAKFMASEDKYLQVAAAQLEVEHHRLLLFLYHSIRPSLVSGAKTISMHLDQGSLPGKGYCPVCGTPAVLSVLDSDGGRSLICGYCWLDWRSQRMFCPSCAQIRPTTVEYLMIEAEPEYRIDVCADCRTYIKTVDARKLDRPLYPPLEALCTIHLDMKAEKEGYVAFSGRVVLSK